MITGVRGSGKTVFMTDISKQIKEDESWIVVELNPEKDLPVFLLMTGLYLEEYVIGNYDPD